MKDDVIRTLSPLLHKDASYTHILVGNPSISRLVLTNEFLLCLYAGYSFVSNIINLRQNYSNHQIYTVENNAFVRIHERER